MDTFFSCAEVTLRNDRIAPWQLFRLTACVSGRVAVGDSHRIAFGISLQLEGFLVLA